MTTIVFDYHPPDELSARFRPLAYGRCEVDVGGRIVDGVISAVLGEIYDAEESFAVDQSADAIKTAPEPSGWRLRITVDEDLKHADLSDVGVRLLA